MFHKALSIPLQLGSIIEHNARRGACMHGHTPPGWRAQAGTQHLIYYHSALSGAQPHYTVFFHFCFILRSVGMNGLLKTCNSHRCHKTVDWHQKNKIYQHGYLKYMFTRFPILLCSREGLCSVDCVGLDMSSFPHIFYKSDLYNTFRETGL